MMSFLLAECPSLGQSETRPFEGRIYSRYIERNDKHRCDKNGEAGNKSPHMPIDHFKTKSCDAARYLRSRFSSPRRVEEKSVRSRDLG
jgi:hypothetical protein